MHNAPWMKTSSSMSGHSWRISAISSMLNSRDRMMRSTPMFCQISRPNSWWCWPVRKGGLASPAIFAHGHNQTRIRHNQRVGFHGNQRLHVGDEGFEFGIVRQGVDGQKFLLRSCASLMPCSRTSSLANSLLRARRGNVGCRHKRRLRRSRRRRAYVRGRRREGGVRVLSCLSFIKVSDDLLNHGEGRLKRCFKNGRIIRFLSGRSILRRHIGIVWRCFSEENGFRSDNGRIGTTGGEM